MLKRRHVKTEDEERIARWGRSPLIFVRWRMAYAWSSSGTWKYKWQRILPRRVKGWICLIWNKVACRFIGHFDMPEDSYSDSLAISEAMTWFNLECSYCGRKIREQEYPDRTKEGE